MQTDSRDIQAEGGSLRWPVAASMSTMFLKRVAVSIM